MSLSATTCHGKAQSVGFGFRVSGQLRSFFGLLRVKLNNPRSVVRFVAPHFTAFVLNAEYKYTLQMQGCTYTYTHTYIYIHMSLYNIYIY